MKIITNGKAITKNRVIEIAAEITKYRLANGRNWKSKLRKSFYEGTNRNSSLQMFRNYFDGSVLDSIKNTTNLKEIIDILEG